MDAIVKPANDLTTEEPDLIPRPGGDLAVQIRLMATAAAARFQAPNWIKRTCAAPMTKPRYPPLSPSGFARPGFGPRQCACPGMSS